MPVASRPQIARYTDPAIHAYAITPSDSTTITVTRGIYIGGAGDVTVLMACDDNSVVFTAVNAGTILPLSVQKVLATGTTATSIVGLA